MFAVNIPDLAIIAAFSLVIALVNTLSYRFLGNYEAMKKAKKAMDEVRKRSKGKLSEKDIEEISKHQSEYMRHSLRPMIISVALLMLLFPLFTKYVGDAKIENGTANVHGMSIVVGNGTVMVDGEELPLHGNIFFHNGRIFEINGSKVSTVIVLLPLSLPFFGNTIGWLFSYIVLVLVISQAVRKVLGMGV